MSIVSEKEEALNSVNFHLNHSIFDFVNSYVKNCIIKPKEIVSPHIFCKDLQDGNVLVKDHFDYNSDLYLMVLGIVETMQELELERDFAEDMFENVVNEIYGEKEDDY